MACRKHTPGNPCCVAPDCVTQCSSYIPETTWTISVLGQSLSLVQHPTYKCYYQAEICWLDTITEDYTFNLGEGWEDDPTAPYTPTNPCVPGICDGLTYDVAQTQIHYRSKAKRFNQTRKSLFVSISPTSPTSNLLQVTVLYDIRKRYLWGWSETARVRYRISTGTCPTAPTLGSWVSSSAPTMPSVEVPSFFFDCPSLTMTNPESCPYSLGSEVSPTTWGTFSIGTIREIRTDYGCYIRSFDGTVPNDIGIRKSVYPGLLFGGWCDTTRTVNLCDFDQARNRTYLSATFACDSIPATIACDSGLSTIADSTVVSSGCGDGGDISTTYPGIPGSVTVTL